MLFNNLAVKEMFVLRETELAELKREERSKHPLKAEACEELET